MTSLTKADAGGIPLSRQSQGDVGLGAVTKIDGTIVALGRERCIEPGVLGQSRLLSGRPLRAVSGRHACARPRYDRGAGDTVVPSGAQPGW